MEFALTDDVKVIVDFSGVLRLTPGSMDFKLGGKEFTMGEEVAGTLQKLDGKQITLRMTTDNRETNARDLFGRSEFAVNEDHRFLERLAEVGPNVLEMWLGS